MALKTKLILRIHSHSQIPYETRLKALMAAALRQNGDSGKKPENTHA